MARQLNRTYDDTTVVVRTYRPVFILGHNLAQRRHRLHCLPNEICTEDFAWPMDRMRIAYIDNRMDRTRLGESQTETPLRYY